MTNKVISADDHIDLRWLPKDLWTERLPSKLRERGPHVEITEKGEYWICGGEVWDTLGSLQRCRRKRRHVGSGTRRRP